MRNVAALATKVGAAEVAPLSGPLFAFAGASLPRSGQRESRGHP